MALGLSLCLIYVETVLYPIIKRIQRSLRTAPKQGFISGLSLTFYSFLSYSQVIYAAFIFDH